MSWTVSESDNEVMRKNQVNSPSIDEGGCGGSMAGGSRALKKGPWTSMEDAILVDYVKKHGEGNWNAVQKHSGLLRCGKSCRLRWANHLRPNLKKGAFTQEEEQLIIELHARMGNKWARMAAHLPGRTDNEIKNYWNTRIKRLQRAGLPLYPSNVFPGSNENEQSQGDDEFSSGEKQHNDFLQGSNYEIPEFKIDNLVANQGVLSYAPLFPEISLNNMLSQGTGSQNYGFMSPTVSHTKRLQDSETLFPGFHGNISGLPTLEQSPNEPPEKIHHTLGLGYQYDTDPVTKSPMQLGGGIPGNHAFLNGNYSASRPLPGTVKLELPSLQYTVTDHSGWLTSPSTTPELVDTYIQSPPVTQLLQYDCVSPQNSGLLEAMLQGAQTLGIAKKRSSENSSNFSVVTPSEMAGRSTINICETDWEGYNDPVSPLGHSAASVFDACTPPMSGSSMDELSPPKAPSGLDALMATGKCGSKLSIEESPLLPCSEFPRPDALLGSDWFEASSQITGDHCMMNDAIATLLGEDLCNNYKNAPSGMSSTFGQGNEFHSYPWNNMPMSHV